MLLTLSLSKCALFYSSNGEAYGTICEEHQDRKQYVIASACDIVQTHNVATCLQHSLHLHSSLQTVVQLGTLHPAVLGHRECGRLDQRDVTCTFKRNVVWRTLTIYTFSSNKEPRLLCFVTACTMEISDFQSHALCCLQVAPVITWTIPVALLSSLNDTSFSSDELVNTATLLIVLFNFF